MEVRIQVDYENTRMNYINYFIKFGKFVNRCWQVLL